MDRVTKDSYKSRVVGLNVTLLRLARGQSANDLSRQCSRIGFELDRSAISRIESGTRKITVDELAVLARALGHTEAELLQRRPVPLDSPQTVLDRERQLVAFERGMRRKLPPGPDPETGLMTFSLQQPQATPAAWIVEPPEAFEPMARNVVISVDDFGKITVQSGGKKLPIPGFSGPDNDDENGN